MTDAMMTALENRNTDVLQAALQALCKTACAAVMRKRTVKCEYLLLLLYPAAFLFPAFSQYHPLISALLLCLIPVLVGAALAPLSLCHSMPMGKKQLKTALVRLSCGAAALVLLPPAILACTIYQLDQLCQMARGEVWKEILTIKPADTDAAALENQLSPQLILLDQGSPEAVAAVLRECRHKLQNLVSEVVDWTSPASATPCFDEAGFGTTICWTTSPTGRPMSLSRWKWTPTHTVPKKFSMTPTI